MPEFSLMQCREIKVKEGWGVDVVPIWDTDHADKIEDIVVTVYQIAPYTVHELSGAWCVVDEANQNCVPVENFKELEDLTQDDTHDLRTRWFATQDAADAWADLVKTRWSHPEPWRNFVCLQ